MSLTAKQQRFVEEYLVDLNATQAAIRAGYSEDTAKEIGYENLTKPHIAEAIQAAMDERAKRTEITADRVLQELAKLGFSNMSDYYDESGNLIPPHQLPKHLAAAIQEVQEEQVGPAVKRKYKLSDKRGSLELLGKHLKLFTDKVEHGGPNGGDIPLGITVKFVGK